MKACKTDDYGLLMTYPRNKPKRAEANTQLPRIMRKRLPNFLSKRVPIMPAIIFCPLMISGI